MIFFCPIAHRLYHELAHHGALACRLVSAARSIASLSVGGSSIKISGNSTLKITAMKHSCVVKHHIHYYTDAGFMQSHNHLLKLFYADFGGIRICRIRAVGHIIVFRVVTPVVLRSILPCLVHRREIERWEQLHMRYAKLFKMSYSRSFAQIRMRTLFGKSKELSVVSDTRYSIRREVAVMHLVYYNIGEALQRRTHIATPPLRVGRLQVDDSGTVAVHANRLCHHTRSITLPHIVYLNVKRVELAFQITICRGCPYAGRIFRHRYHTIGRTAFSFLVQQYPRFACGRCPYLETGLRRRVSHLVPLAIKCRIVFKCIRSIVLYRRTTYSQRHERH